MHSFSYKLIRESDRHRYYEYSCSHCGAISFYCKSNRHGKCTYGSHLNVPLTCSHSCCPSSRCHPGGVIVLNKLPDGSGQGSQSSSGLFDPEFRPMNFSGGQEITEVVPGPLNIYLAPLGQVIIHSLTPTEVHSIPAVPYQIPVASTGTVPLDLTPQIKSDKKLSFSDRLKVLEEMSRSGKNIYH